VLAYLVRLAVTYDITLISFEKGPEPPAALRKEVTAAGIEWIPLRYHREPPVLSTLFDVYAGRRSVIHAARRGVPAIVHARSYVAALIAVTARRSTGGRLLFDIRGFWADERVEGGLWRSGGVLYRVAKRCERRFFADADAIVTLTHSSLPQIRAWTGERRVPIEVIPTCVDVQKFSRRPERPGGPHAVWSGSVGTWYRFDLAPRIAAALSMQLTVITRQVQTAHRLLAGHAASVYSATPDEVPGQLFAGDVGLCLITSSFSKRASSPTRFAEYLAAGMPVVATPGVGDLEEIIEQRRIGVVLRAEDPTALAEAGARLRTLLNDRGLIERCRGTAAELFDVESGSGRYAELYRRLTED
jgi:glycosyltransferase involved in cell wall biosynthesis